MTAKTASRFLWHDLDSPEPERVLAFYGDVLGWNAAPYGDGPMRYWTWMHDGAPVGGIGELTDEARKQGGRPGWNGYIESRDVDRDADRVASLGGRVRMAPVTLEGVGRMAVVEDPQGAAFTLFAPAPMEGPPPGDSPFGRFMWHDLGTTDPDAAWSFYTELFGWQESRRVPMGDMGAYRIFAADGVELGGMMKSPSAADAPGWLYYVQVRDIEDTVDRVRSGGGDVVHDIMPVPGGRIAVCRDPEGAEFGLHEQATSGSER